MSKLMTRKHRGFDIGKQLSLAICFVGILLVAGQFAAEVRDGSASLWLLIPGSLSAVFGLVCSLQFVTLIRLHRVEQSLEQIHNESNRESIPE